MKRTNPVAKNIHKVNRPSTHLDKIKERLPLKEDLVEAAKTITANRYGMSYDQDEEKKTQQE